MKKIFLLSCVSILFTFCKGQGVDSLACKSAYYSKLNTYFYITASNPAEYPQGDDSLYNYIYTNVKFDDLSKNDIDFSYGEKLIALAYIDEKGQLIDLQLVKKSWITKCGIYDNQIVKLIKEIPQWTPAECNGKKIPFRKTLVISFSLRKISLYIKNDETS